MSKLMGLAFLSLLLVASITGGSGEESANEYFMAKAAKQRAEDFKAMDKAQEEYYKGRKDEVTDCHELENDPNDPCGTADKEAAKTMDLLEQNLAKRAKANMKAKA